jgi:hypothetical protein
MATSKKNKRKKKRIIFSIRNWVAVAAHFRKGGKMRDRRKRRQKDKEQNEVRNWEKHY